MTEAAQTLRQGEAKPFYATATAETGTVRVNPIPTITLADATGTPLPGLTGIPATGYTADPATSASVWYLLDTGPLSPGSYTLAFDYSLTGSDGLTRQEKTLLALDILPPLTLPGGWPTPASLRAAFTAAGITPDPALDLETALAAAIALLQSRLRRSYTPVTERRRFDGGNRELLPIDPLLSFSRVEYLLPERGLATSSATDPTVLETTEAHGLVSGMTVMLRDHLGSVPNLNNTLYTATVLDATHLSLPVAVTTPGTGGYLEITQEVLDRSTYQTYPPNERPIRTLRRVTGSILTWGDPELRWNNDYEPQQRHRGYPPAFWRMGARNVAITGVWGDADGPPPDVALAAQNLAFLHLLGFASMKLSEGIVSWTEGSSSESYGNAPYLSSIQTLQDQVDTVLATRKKRRLVVP